MPAPGPFMPPSEALNRASGPLLPASEALNRASGPLLPASEALNRVSGPLLPSSEALNRASDSVPASEALNRVSGPLLPGSEALNRASERLLPASEPWKGAAGLVKPVRKGVGRGTRHKVMQPTVRKPVGSVRNRARLSPAQRCRLAPGRRSNEEDGLDPDAVQRAAHPAPAAVQDMGVDHARRERPCDPTAPVPFGCHSRIARDGSRSYGATYDNVRASECRSLTVFDRRWRMLVEVMAAH